MSTALNLKSRWTYDFVISYFRSRAHDYVSEQRSDERLACEWNKQESISHHRERRMRGLSQIAFPLGWNLDTIVGTKAIARHGSRTYR